MDHLQLACQKCGRKHDAIPPRHSITPAVRDRANMFTRFSRVRLEYAKDALQERRNAVRP